MLDFQKLVRQIRSVSIESLLTGDSDKQTLQKAQAAYADATSSPQALTDKLIASELHSYWPLAMPIEPFGQICGIDRHTTPVTVVAADGSQIMPSHHEICNCYLLNIGTAVFSYGVKLPPLMESTPHLFHSPEDLFPLVDRRRIHVDDLFVSLERNLLELTTVRSLALTARKRNLPVVAFVDGGLLPFSLEKMPENYQRTYLLSLTEVLESFRQNRIPLLGYISQSRSADIVNELRIWQCPYPSSSCLDYCAGLNEDDFPCSAVSPCTDRQLLSPYLPPYYRSNTFASGFPINRALPPCHHTAFAYVNVGYEVARLEFPRWLAMDTSQFDLAMAVAVSQSEKGMGYPVCLSEAHNQAVIRSSDRSYFFDLLLQHLVQIGVQKVQVSQKENRKRRGII